MVSIIKSDVNYIDVNDLIIANDKFWKNEKPTEEWKDKKEYEIKEKETNKIAKELQKLFQQKENCLFLTWAWISTFSWLPLMWHLWQYFSWWFIWDSLEKEKERDFFKNHKNNFEEYIKYKNHEIFNELATKFWETENIETFLSKLSIFISWFELDTSEENEELKKAKKLKKIIEKELKKLCFIEDNQKDTEYKYFLQYLTSIRWEKNKSRLKIFTLNYDLLFEETASRYLYTIIDGFSFTSPRRFASSNFDLDIVEKKDNRLENNSMHSRVFHLYKMHGSLNWNKKEGIIKITTPEIITDLEKEEQWMIIYPWKAKYEESYNMPYFEMLTRFQFELRRKETVLNIIWYWFWDTHINQMIFESLKNNTSLTINVFSSPDKKLYSFEEIESIEYLNLNEKFKELYPYFFMKRINIYNMRFWWLVNLLSINLSDIETPESQLFNMMNSLFNTKIWENEIK